jgi:hypothetical protein
MSGMNRKWIERWHGSGPDRGWAIWEREHGDRIAYVGEGEHSERLTSLIVAAHNAALASQAREVPEGWKLVPVNSTMAMNAAGFAVPEAEHDPSGVYRAMLEAAPSIKAAQPASGEPE